MENIISIIQHPFSFYNLFWLFMSGCFIGTFHEVLWNLIVNRKLYRRQGVIYGPFIPVYGFAAVILYLCLSNIRSEELIFLSSFFIGGAFEYFCSFIQEKVFWTKSWDYSGYKMNIKGRTSIYHSVCWGILGSIFMFFYIPLFLKLIGLSHNIYGFIFTSIAVILMAYNLFISSIAVIRQKQRRQKIKAKNKFEEWLDKHYPDEYLEKVFTNMYFVK